MIRSASVRATSGRGARISFFSLLLITVLVLFAGRPANAMQFNAAYGFGDSLSDTGNAFIASGIPPSPPYFNGRVSNGPVWLEVAAGLLGLSVDPVLAGGTNYATAGARTGPIGQTTPPSLLDQVALYLSTNSADPNALYVVFGGGNDIRDLAVANTVANLSSIITDLADAGAEHFFVPNLPDVGKTPAAIAAGPAASAFATSLSVQVNTQLAAAIPTLRDDLGVNIIEFDTFTFLNNLIANPGMFGFTNVDGQCLDFDTFIPCANPDEYVFWDDIHPTAATGHLFGEAAYNTIIPIPAAVWLFGSALGILGWVRRRAA
ncbi:MAG: SGNH/GDSL hydrolase family protein [Gammaproteobacteria bacterium]|nr:SGNH/GDSL hydrolase family protein [Gammaproteobacteria bacterium]